MIFYNNLLAKWFLRKGKKHCFMSLFFSRWWMLLPFATYHIFYWLEKSFRSHSVFDWEALENCGDTLYLRKRKAYAWMRWYGKKVLPLSDWDD